MSTLPWQAASDEPPPRLLERRTASALLQRQRSRACRYCTRSPQRCRRNAVAATLSIGATVTAACVVL